MVATQDIHFILSENERIKLDIEKNDGQLKFMIKITVEDLKKPPLIPFNNGPYSSPKEAFDVAFEWIEGWLKKQKRTLIRIYNPIVGEFISHEEQQIIIKSKGYDIPVEINKICD